MQVAGSNESDLSGRKARSFLEDEGWLESAEGQFAEILGDRLWGEISSRWNTTRCRELAWTAKALESIKTVMDQTPDDLTVWITPSDSPPLLREAVGAVLRRFDPRAGAQLRQTALALRALGVCLCAVQKRDLGLCECFKALTEDMGRDEVRETLRVILPRAA